MKDKILFFIKMILAGCIAIVVLSAVNIPWSYTGVHIDNKTGATDYIWESNQLRTNMSEGFAWLKMDKFGFNNTKENTEKAMLEGIDILLMGSSHMEAMQVPKDRNLGALLNERLEDMNTYNIGMSGHDVYRILDNVKTAAEVYQPSEYLLMEIDEIELDIEKMQAVIDETAKKIPSYDSGIVYQLQKIPAIKWIYKSLEEWINQSKSVLDDGLNVFAREEINVGTESYEEVLAQFLDICVQACEQTGCEPIIFYHHQPEILQDSSITFNTDEQYLDLFATVCEQKGITFIDMSPVFTEEYEKNHRLPHGFINTYVGSGHINAHGHRMLADKLTGVIMEKQEND